MILALDTSILIDLEKKNKETIKVIKELVKTHPNPAQLPFISYFEFLYGIQQRNPKNKQKAIDFANRFHTLTTTKRTAHILSTMKKKYDNEGIPLSLSDLLIASQVKEHNLLLVTKDKDFEHIEEINCVVV